MNQFAERTQAWKELILANMIIQINNDPNKTVDQRRRDKALLKGVLGERLAVNRICLALGISERQYIRRLVKVHTPKPRKPSVVR